jgi:hypothetical protein
LAYSTSNASCYRVLIADCFEVFALAFLCKGNTSVVSVDNATIKLEVMGGGKTFTFLSQKPGLL